MKGRKSLWLVALGVAGLTGQLGCTSHLYNIAAERQSPTISAPMHGSIEGEGNRNARILRSSGIVVPGAPGRTVELSALRDIGFKCGMPLLATDFSLGILPGEMPAAAEAKIVTVDSQGATRELYVLRLYSRYSLWEALNFWHNDDVAIARALAWAYVQQRHVENPNAGADTIRP